MLEKSEVRDIVVNGTVDQIKAMIDKHPDTLTRKYAENNNLFSTVLKYAVVSDDLEKVDLVLKHGATVEEDYLGLIFHWVKSIGHETSFDGEVLSVLIENGIKFPEVQEPCSYFIQHGLDECFRQDNVALFDCLLEHGFDPVACEKTGEECALTTALMYVESEDDTKVVRRLMELGCDLAGYSEYYYMPPLLKALRNGLFRTCEELIARGACLKMPFKDPEGLDYDLASVLVLGSHIPADLLIPIFDANIDLSYTCDGDTLLHQVCGQSNITLMEHLLEKGLDINTRNDKGNTPIMCAARNGEEKAILYLLESGADLALANNNGSTVLDIALREKSLKQICDVLVAAGATQGTPSRDQDIKAKKPKTKNAKGKSVKKVKMDQYCVIQHTSDAFNQAIVRYTNAADRDYWGDKSDDAESRKFKVEQFGPAVFNYLATIDATELPSIICVLSQIEFLPVSDTLCYACIEDVKFWLKECDLPLVKGERIREVLEAVFAQLGVAKVTYKSSTRYHDLRVEAMFPVVEDLIESMQGQTTPESVLTSMFHSLNAPSSNDSLQSALAKGITDDVLTLARLKPENGTKLSAEARATLIGRCRDHCIADIDGYLDRFVEIAHILTSLDEIYQRGELMDPDNAKPFEELKQQRQEFLHDNSMQAYLCQYYQSVLNDIAEEQYLGSIIQRFDHALFFSDMLFGYLDIDGAADIMRKGISSYVDLEVWVNYFVLDAYRQQYEKERAA